MITQDKDKTSALHKPQEVTHKTAEFLGSCMMFFEWWPTLQTLTAEKEMH